ncbi:MAG: tandem-95 repeat protein [Candidatus Accumulibacter sp.]|nr:tandem-95 repeat protein [Accumulibacter sp.]
MVNADGSFTYTPDADYHGPDSFTYTLTDADGDVSTATALLTVNPIDDLPVAVDDTFLTDEDSALTGQTLAPNDTPSGDGGNTWALATGPSHGSVVVNADGSFTYTPDADYHGPDSFTYTLTDADGDVSTATALLTVNPIDDLPVAVDDTFLTDEDSALTGQTLAPNDTPSGDGGNTWALATGPSHGSVVVNADGSFTYTPDADYHGPDSFTYTLTDADGDVSTATALLTVNPIDDLPVAVDDTFLTDEDSALTGQTLATNDTPSGDGGNTWALATGPSHGSVVVNADGSFTYTPDADYHGPDSFTYTLTDADGDVSTATALPEPVNPIDDLPVAVDDTFLTNEDSALTTDPGPNDTPRGMAATPGHSPPDPATAAWWSTRTAASSTPRARTTTAPTASPTPLTDADGDVSTATALLTVNPIDDLPVAVDDTFLTDEDSALTGQTLAPTTPSGDGGNTWALATGPSHGSVVVNADGSFTYTPDADYHGPDSFTYTLTDADGDVSTATITITVTAAELTGLPPDFNQPESLLAGLRLGPLAFQPGTRVNDSMRQPIPFQPAAFVTSAVEASQLERAFNDPEGNGTDIAAVSPYETRLTSETRELGFVPAVFVQSSVRQSQADAHFLDLRVSGRQGVVKLSSDERLPSFSLFQAPPLGQTIEEIRREEREQRDRRSSGDERIAAIREQAAPAIALTVASPVAAGVIGRTVATRAFSEQLRDASARLRPLADIRSLQHLHKSST